MVFQSFGGIMYEPFYIPDISMPLISTEGVRYGITHSAPYRVPDDSAADPLHIHEAFELFFNVSGNVSFSIGDRILPVPMGGAVLTQPNEVHKCIYNSPCLNEHYCLWINAPQDSVFHSLLIALSSPTVFSFDVQAADMLHSHLRELSEMLPLEDASDASERMLHILYILLLLRKKGIKMSAVPTIPSELQHILSQIDEDPAEVGTVSDLAKAHFISPSTLNRWFRQYLKVSPREYLESKKMARAIKLLDNGASVTTTCFQSGFSDCAHFIRLFKRKFGQTPLQYKKTEK